MAVFSFAFLNPFLPEGKDIGKNLRKKEVDVLDIDVRERTRAWMTELPGMPKGAE